MKINITIRALISAVFLISGTMAFAEAKKKIVFVAGNRSHGWGAHEFNAGSLLMETHLKEALGGNVETVVHKNGWPKVANPFQGADAIILFMDGGGGHPINRNIDQVKKEIDRGCGLMCMHYAVEVPAGRSGKALQQWIGGYYETGWSINPHWVAVSKLNKKHPVTRGVQDFKVKDEWYFNMRFREGKKGVTSILDAVPDDVARSGKSSWPRGPKKHIVEASGRAETLCWSVKRDDGGRGVGFTGAHFHANFGDDGFRKLVLNAVAWTAGIDIPEKGLVSHRPDETELDANQDFKKPGSQKKKVATKPKSSKAKAKFSSKTISKSTPGHSVNVDVDISGATKLYLVVDDAGDGYAADWADWAEPRIIIKGKETKLTDLKWKSAKVDWGQARIGKNAGGGNMKINGKDISYGIGVHANSILEYDLPKGAERFKAICGLDNGGTDQGALSPSVRFQVFTEKPKIAARKAGGGGGLDAADSLDLLEVADGMRAEIFASEPMILSPSSIDIDHKGRVWVAEIVNYRGHNGKRAEGDRILILEDTNGDGLADTVKTFYQGRDIDSPHGVCVLGDKVIVSAGEQVLLFTDTNGDDKPDDKKVLFNVVGGKQHDHGIHAFCFGPDGKLYFNFGNASRGLKTPDGKVIIDKMGNEVMANRKPYQQGMVFRCNLDGSNVETLGWNFRNNWEATVDSFGSIWQSDNDDDGNRGVRINYVMEFGNYGYRDEFTGKGWRDKRSNIEKEIPLRHWHLNDPGVVPNLIQTGAGSPTGIIVYEGKMFPSLLHQVIHCDAGPNVCRAYPRKNSGAGYSAEMLPLLSGGGDRWYRPSDVAVAPDGSLLVADWYDPGVGGHGMRDLDRGRIFRLIPEDHDGYKMPKLNIKTLSGAIEALKSPNFEMRYLAWNSLHSMGRKESEGALLKMMGSEDSIYAARAAWCLGKMPGAGKMVIEKLKGHKDSDLRIVSIRLSRQLGHDVVGLVSDLSKDKNPQVRRECAIALRELDAKSAASVWADLAMQHDGSDRWYLEALGIGAEGKWNECFDAWVKAGGKWSSPSGRDIVWRSRSKYTPGLLAKIVKDPSTKEDEKPRYMRAFDFHSGPEKDAALQSILLD